MKSLVLFYVNKNLIDEKLLVSENLEDVREYNEVDVVLKSNAYDINCYLLKHELEVSNPNFLKIELDEIRKNGKVPCVGDFWRSIELKKGWNRETFNIIIASYLNLQLEASKHVENAIETDSLRARCLGYVSDAIERDAEEVQENMELTAYRIKNDIYTIEEATKLMIR